MHTPNFRRVAGVACLLMGAAGAVAAADRLPFRSSFETGNFSDWNGGLEASMRVSHR